MGCRQCQVREENVVRIMHLKTKPGAELDLEATLKQASWISVSSPALALTLTQIFEEHSPAIITGTALMSNMVFAMDAEDVLLYMVSTHIPQHPGGLGA